MIACWSEDQEAFSDSSLGVHSKIVPPPIKAGCVHSREPRFSSAESCHTLDVFRPCRSTRLRRFAPHPTPQVSCTLQPVMGFAVFQAASTAACATNSALLGPLQNPASPDTRSCEHFSDSYPRQRFTLRSVSPDDSQNRVTTTLFLHVVTAARRFQRCRCPLFA